ncbi:MAG: hypothetical protein DRJ66_01805 [Thermoprotei archaeon]|nr:MAG: hypothetical protein DRJ66_01805 [Thermoprotei archaeon]RLF19247.1 MAG: hypothetical protein DRZ82_06450 [Thermoprotei archaeon]
MSIIEEIAQRLEVPYELNTVLRLLGKELEVDLVIPNARRPLIIVKIIEEECSSLSLPLLVPHLPTSLSFIEIDDMFEYIKERGWDVACICVAEDEVAKTLKDKMIFYDELLFKDPTLIAKVLNEIARNPYYPIFSIIRDREGPILAIKPIGRYLTDQGRPSVDLEAKGFIGLNPIEDKVYIRNLDAILRMIAKGVPITMNVVKLRELKELLHSNEYVKKPKWLGEIKEEEVLLRDLVKYLMSCDEMHIPKELEGIKDGLSRILAIK